MQISGKKINIGLNLVLSVLLSCVYLSFHTVGYYDVILRILAAIGLIPVISSSLILFKTREIRMAVMTLVLYQTWHMFLEPYTWTMPVESLYRVFNNTDFPEMALFSDMSLFALYIGFMRSFGRVSAKPFFKESYMSALQLKKVVLWMIIGGYLLGFLQIIINMIGLPFGFLGLIDTMLPATVGAVFLLYFLRGGRNILLTVLVIFYMIYYFIYYVGGTLFVYSIFLVLAPTVVYIVERRKVPYLVLCVTIILLLPIYITRHNYRNEGLYSTGAIRMAIGTDILVNEYSNISFERWKQLYDEEQRDKNVDNRTEGVSYLGQVVNCHKRKDYPYLLGKTMMWLPTMVVPHFILPFRPSQNMGDEWAIYYKLKDPSWKASINFPMLVEFYANFGYLGMIVFQFFNGILIVWFMRKFNDGIGDINLLLLIFIITKIVVVEANVSLAYGAVLQVMTICWLFKKIVQKRI